MSCKPHVHTFSSSSWCEYGWSPFRSVVQRMQSEKYPEEWPSAVHTFEELIRICKGKSSLTVTSMAAEAGEAAPLLPQHTTAEPPETPAGCKFEEFFKLGVWQNQWPLQEPKLEVPTIFKAYFSGLNFRGYPHKIWPKIWYIMVPPSVGS